jgi:hypothetical protein
LRSQPPEKKSKLIFISSSNTQKALGYKIGAPAKGRKEWGKKNVVKKQKLTKYSPH